MAKIIKYKIIAGKINNGTEENPNIEQILQDKEIICDTKAQYDANLPIAEREAVPGTLDIDPNGEFEAEEPTKPSLENRVENLETETSDLSEALEMILNGVTE